MAGQAEAHDALYGNHKLADHYPALPSDLLNFHHDPLAVAVVAGWNGLRIEEVALRLELQPVSGLVRDPDGQRLRVVTELDADGFNAYWLRAVTGTMP